MSKTFNCKSMMEEEEKEELSIKKGIILILIVIFVLICGIMIDNLIIRMILFPTGLVMIVVGFVFWIDI